MFAIKPVDMVSVSFLLQLPPPPPPRPPPIVNAHCWRGSGWFLWSVTHLHSSFQQRQLHCASSHQSLLCGFHRGKFYFQLTIFCQYIIKNCIVCVFGRFLKKCILPSYPVSAVFKLRKRLMTENEKHEFFLYLAL